jgi:glyoxylase-like metal-dependent hydrolase (beta-lactamase superfamily II)
MRQQDLGGVLVDTVDDGSGMEFGLRRLLPEATEDHIEELIAAFGDEHINAETLALRLSLHSFLVRTKHHTILVDTCLGNDKERPTRPRFSRRKTPYLAILRGLGVAPEDVDFVLCTHMHHDHIGWNTRLEDGRWVPTFPNARYMMAEREYAYWLERTKRGETVNHGAFADSILPVVERGQAVFVKEDDVICENVRYEHFPGHSPGNVVIRLEGSAGHALCTGDIVHSPVQFRFPHLLTSCEDPLLARESRLKVFEMAADTDAMLLPAHFKSPTAGRVRREGARYRYDFVDG